MKHHEIINSKKFHVVPDYTALIVNMDNKPNDYTAVMPNHARIMSHARLISENHGRYQRKSKVNQRTFFGFILLFVCGVMLLSTVAIAKGENYTLENYMGKNHALDHRLILHNEINDDVVRLEDIMENLPAELAATVIGPAPPLGKSYDIPVRFINKVMQKLKYPWQANDMVRSVTITRAAQYVDDEDISQLLQDYIKNHNLLSQWGLDSENLRIDMSLVNIRDRIMIPEYADYDDIVIRNVHYRQSQNQVQAILALSQLERSLKDIKIKMKLIPKQQVVVARNTIRNGQTISHRDVALQWRPVSKIHQYYLSDINDVIGLEATNIIRNDGVVNDQHLREPLMVRKKDTVLLRYRINFMELTTKAKALQDGRLGDYIRVKNVKSGREVEGRITQAGVVSASPMNIGSSRSSPKLSQKLPFQHQLFGSPPIPLAKINESPNS